METLISAIPQVEIDKVKKEWEDKVAQKSKSKEDGPSKDANKDKGKEAEDKHENKPKSKPSSPSEKNPSPVASPSKSPPPESSIPLHAKFALHRDIFAMRLTEHRRKKQAQAAKELAPRLPGAPRGQI